MHERNRLRRLWCGVADSVAANTALIAGRLRPTLLEPDHDDIRIGLELERQRHAREQQLLWQRHSRELALQAQEQQRLLHEQEQQHEQDAQQRKRHFQRRMQGVVSVLSGVAQGAAEAVRDAPILPGPHSPRPRPADGSLPSPERRDQIWVARLLRAQGEIMEQERSALQRDVSRLAFFSQQGYAEEDCPHGSSGSAPAWTDPEPRF